MTTARVMHVLPDLATGGGQGVVLQLVRCADRGRFDVSVASLGPPDDLVDAFTAAGAPPVSLRHAPGRSASTAARLARLVRRRRIDILHVHSGPDRKVGHLAALATGTPVIGHLHSPWDHRQPMFPAGAGRLEQLASRSKAAVRGGIERRVVRHYIAAGDQVGAFHEPWAHTSITVVPNGVDIDAFGPSTGDERSRLRAELGVPADVPVVVCVGRLVDGKGHDDLVQAVAALEGTWLLLVGDGDRRAELEDLCRRVGASDRVRFAGDRRDVPAVLGACDVFALASRSEGLPLAVLEAMAAGLPVVATALPGVVPLLAGGAGEQVPPADVARLAAAIARLVADPSARARLGTAARARVEALGSAAAMTRAVERVYESVAAPRREVVGR
jgi:glycosyltransferase involved in cell wall biosynthesis